MMTVSSWLGRLPSAGITTVISLPASFTDDDVTSIRSQSVTVLTPAQGVQNAITLVSQLLAAGKLNGGNANALISQLDGAKKQLERGKTGAALQMLTEILEDVSDLVTAGRLTAADAEPLRALVARVIESISP